MSKAASDKCYAVMWSYGIICVGCGCCKRGAYKARIAYHREQLRDDRAKVKNPEWWDKDPEMAALQLHNHKANIAYSKRKIKALRAKVTAKRYREGVR